MGMTIGIGHVGFDVVDRGPVHKVGTKYVDDWPFGGIQLYALNLDRG